MGVGKLTELCLVHRMSSYSDQQCSWVPLWKGSNSCPIAAEWQSCGPRPFPNCGLAWNGSICLAFSHALTSLLSHTAMATQESVEFQCWIGQDPHPLPTLFSSPLPSPPLPSSPLSSPPCQAPSRFSPGRQVEIEQLGSLVPWRLSLFPLIPDLEITVPIRHSQHPPGKVEFGVYESGPRKSVFPPRTELRRGDWKSDSTSSTASEQGRSVPLHLHSSWRLWALPTISYWEPSRSSIGAWSVFKGV